MSRLSRMRLLASALAFVCLGVAFGQLDPGTEIKKSRAEEIKKFHPKVVAPPAELWLRGYEHRLKLESASPFGQLKWRNVGPEIQGGRVVDFEVPPGQDGVMYIGYATGGLWRTDDAGQTWRPLFDRECAFGIGDLAIAKDGKTIYLGTGENNSQRTSYAGSGMFKSADAGKTWQYIGLPESQHIGRVLIHPNDNNTVYVGVLGHLYSQNGERGVYKTSDGGKTWQHILKLDDQTGVIDLVMDPRNPNIMYAAAWDRDRRAWNFRESGPGSGVYKTTDGGKTWKLMTNLPHGEAAGRIGVAIAPSDPNRVYVYIDNHDQDQAWLDRNENVPGGNLTPRRFTLLTEETFLAMDQKILESFFRQYAPTDLKLEDVLKKVKDKEMTMAQVREAINKRNGAFNAPKLETVMYRSDDGGKTFRETESGPLGGNSYYYFGNVIVNPTDPDDVFATGTFLTRSRDGGKTWRVMARNAHVDFHAVWFNPRDPKHIVVGNDGGAYETKDDGVNWRHFNNMPVGQVTTIAVDNKNPYNVYVGMQDNGTMRGPSTYRPGISSLNLWQDIDGGDGSAIAVDPRDGGDVVYTASQFGSHSGQNQKTKERWNARARAGRGEPPLRYNWVSPILISPHHPDIIYLGAQRLFRSFNQGRSYEPISPDLTKDKPNGNVPFSTLKDISESPLKFGLIYIGADDGNVKMTPDGGNTWKDIPTPTPDKWVSRIVASKYDLATVYCAQSGYREDDFRPYLYKSTDYGKTWTSIAGDLPMETINVIREDPARKDILYVGTDMGVFVTYDGGKRWEALQGDLPHGPVHDMVIQERDNDLVIGTHSRSAWILPLKLVHELTPEIRAKDLTLFTVDNMRRDRNWGYPRGFNSAFSEPTVPTVKINIFSKLPGKGAIRIKDKDGKVVKEKAIDAATGYNFYDLELKIAEGAAKPGPRQVTKPEDVLKDPFEATLPKFLEVGDYTIEVEVNGKTVTQPWKLTAPPA